MSSLDIEGDAREVRGEILTLTTKLAVGTVFLATSVLGWSQEKPLAPWGVHTVVTSGRTTYEGDKIRAVLVYGETGGPRISIERIHVDMGYPSPSRVDWAARVDVLGDRPDPCPVAETYCASVENLRWSGDILLYEVVAPSSTLHCRVDEVASRAPRTTCDSGSRVVHVVLVWLKEPGNPDHRQQIIETTRGFSKIPGVDEVRVGEPIPGRRATVDDSFDVGLYMTFPSSQALQSYLSHPEHEAAQRAILKPVVKKVVVYDFEDGGI
jgi:hypothetical protein